MKKIITLALATIMILSVLTGCAFKECSLCGEKKKCETTKVLGQEVNVCQDCIDGISNFFG